MKKRDLFQQRRSWGTEPVSFIFRGLKLGGGRQKEKKMEGAAGGRREVKGKGPESL